MKEYEKDKHVYDGEHGKRVFAQFSFYSLGIVVLCLIVAPEITQSYIAGFPFVIALPFAFASMLFYTHADKYREFYKKLQQAQKEKPEKENGGN